MRVTPRFLLLAATSALLLACPASPTQPTVRDHRGDSQPDPDPNPDPDPQPQPQALADGAACSDSAQCQSGVCEGPGCDEGICAPSQRSCTRDLQPYCGCDGHVFRTSGNCPGRLFANRGECTDAAASGKAVGSECLTAADCTSGVCEGHGCGDEQPGTCMAKDRICTTDLRQYCGCDGQSFGGSSTCPGRRYKAGGACK